MTPQLALDHLWSVAGCDPALLDYASIDGNDPANPYPRNKPEIAHRLALIARSHIYGIPGDFSGPMLEQVVRERDGVRVYFAYADSGLTAAAKPISSACNVPLTILSDCGRASDNAAWTIGIMIMAPSCCRHANGAVGERPRRCDEYTPASGQKVGTYFIGVLTLLEAQFQAAPNGSDPQGQCRELKLPNANASAVA